ncbi:DUF6850 family outer membrane beta-barrel protein [Pedobacter gandavensis]|uniref:DUF6850 family outer membrane beta-barrel protein n=1 Tax=Pedobacter gandavensis TaxID=2679963 RepID=UPI00292ECAB9|nr:DUF6850 family outer membrane beta-barrel protein [Pedobacter gandavensis]
MKKIYFIVLFLQLCLVLVADAQKTDSITSRQSRNFAIDSAAYSYYNFAKNKSFFTATMPDGFNTLSIGHQLTKGRFMPYQESTKTNDTYFATEGKTTLSGVSLWGALSYHKVREDSTSWAHQTRNNTTAPMYFGSARNVNYERSVYQFNAMAQRNMIGNNLPFSLGLDYRIGDHYSTNDPRAKLNDYQFNMQASIGYRITNGLKLGMAGRYGYGQEGTDVAYKNPLHAGNMSTPEYVTHIINGYGDPKPIENNRVFRNEQSRKGIDLYLSYEKSDFGTLAMSASYLMESQKFINKFPDAKNGEFYNDYDLNTYQFNLIWKKKLEKYLLSVLINYDNLGGKDFNYVAQANNYLYSREQWGLKAILSKPGTTSFNYILELKKDGEERQDGIRGNLVSYNAIKPGLGIGFNQLLPGNQSFGLNLRAVYSKNLNAQFIVPIISEGPFTRTVIYHDYVYNTADYLSGSLQADYNFPSYRQIQTGIKLGLTYNEALKYKSLDRTLIASPGKQRFATNVSLNFYF